MAKTIVWQGLESMPYVLFSAHCLIGGVAALLAQGKGYGLGRWLLWGLLGGTATLIIVLRLKPNSTPVNGSHK